MSLYLANFLVISSDFHLQSIFAFFAIFFPSSVFWGFRTPGAYGLFEDSIFF